MFTVTWFPDDSARNPTFEPTLSLERDFGPLGDLFVEYVGEYDHQRPSHQLDGGGVWRFTKRQQRDFHAGFGLNSSSVDHYFGIGYSLRSTVCSPAPAINHDPFRRNSDRSLSGPRRTAPAQVKADLSSDQDGCK